MAPLTRDYGTTRQYLAKVLPWPQDGDPPAWIGITYKSKGSDGKWFWATRGVKSVKDAVATINWALGLKDITDIYVCMGSLRTGEEVTTKKGFKYVKATRNQQEVVGLKSLYIDLDAKGAPDSYDTIEDAVGALFGFLKAIRFPAPSVMVRTGGGVHVYWTLDRILTPEEWLPHASALVHAAQQFGLKFDQGCSIDSARILRIPKTLNHKFTPPKEVELVVVEEGDYSVARIEQALAPYRVAVSKVSTNHIENPALFKGNRAALAENDLSAGVEDFQMPKPDLKDLAKACPFVMEACTTGGAGYAEPLWHNSVQLAMWTQQGEAAAQVMSMGHAGYDQVGTTEKYELSVEAQAARGLGWPQCKTIAGNGSKPCKTCTHLSAAKSPLNFITLQSNAQTITPVNGVVFRSVIQGDIDVPAGYVRDKHGFIDQVLQDETGASYNLRLLDYPLVGAFLNHEPNKGEMLNFYTSTRIGESNAVRLLAANVAGMEMRKELQTVGIMMQSTEVKRVGEFFVSWIKKLQQIKEASSNIEPFGWSDEGFAYGGTLYAPSGNRNAPATDPGLATHYTPCGDLGVWQKAADMVTTQKRPALDAILAAAFAAPLVRATGQPGLLMSLYSLQSGIGKTTAMKVAQAVWGDPVRGLQGLNDTQASVVHKLGKLRSLPMFWDELKTEEDTKRMVNLFFTVTQGREKHRLKSSIEQRESGSWETLLVSASNESMLDYVVNQTKMTTAGVYRMFEFTVDPGSMGMIPISDAARMVSALGTNFGRAGDIYAEFLGNNWPRIYDDVGAEMVAVGADVNGTADERFWVALVAVIVTGAAYSNELGLTTIDVPLLRSFMLDQLHGMRQLLGEQSVDMTKGVNVADLLVQFLRDMRANNTLITDKVWRGRGKPNGIKTLSDVRGPLIVHVASTDRWLRISLSGLQDWLKKRGTGQHQFIEQLKLQFGAKQLSTTMGAGTTAAVGHTFVLDIDVTQRTAKTYLQDLTV